MLIVQITPSYFSHGAVMRRARQETKALLDAGHRVVIMTDLRWKSSVNEVWGYKTKLLIIPIRPFYIHRPFRMISHQLSFTFKVYLALRRLHDIDKIDLIVSHYSTVCLAVGKFSKENNIPSFWVIQDLIKDRMLTGNPYNWFETTLLKFTDRYAFKNIDFLLPVSKYSKQIIRSYGIKEKKIIIKHNAVNTSEFHPIQNIEKDIDILFFGRLSIEKGVDILIESLKNLDKKYRTVIIGDGPLALELKAKAKKVTNQNIEFWGFIDHSKLPEIIPRAKIVITPSRSECHAAVPIESMSCGVPVIASRVAGMEDSIDHKKSGWLLEKNNPQVLSNYIKRVLNDTNNLTQVAKEAQIKAQRFSVAKFQKDIVDFYENIIKDRS